MRSGRKLWLFLVLFGIALVLASLGLALAALCRPEWVHITTNVQDRPSITRRGLFENCIDDACHSIARPEIVKPNLCTSCVSDEQKTKFVAVSRLRLADWGLHITGLGVEGITALGCIIYLLKIRYCAHKPSAQKAQICLCVCGFILWISGLIGTIANILFLFTLTMERISKNTGLNGVFMDIPETSTRNVKESFEESFTFIWISIAFTFLAGWMWLSAAYTQTPAHVVFRPVTVSQCPLFTTERSLSKT